MAVKKTGSREYFVSIVDTKDPKRRRVAVGNFHAESAGEAIDKAKKTYHGFFDHLETRDWSVRAEEIFARRIVAEEMKEG